jgi:hypothetical protein
LQKQDTETAQETVQTEGENRARNRPWKQNRIGTKKQSKHRTENRGNRGREQGRSRPTNHHKIIYKSSQIIDKIIAKSSQHHRQIIDKS